MVKLSSHLDLRPKPKPPVSARRVVPVVVEKVSEDGGLEVRVLGSDAPAVVVDQASPGLWAEGAHTTAHIDSTGRISTVLPPVHLPQDTPTVAVGDAARKLKAHEERLASIRAEWQSDVETAKELLSSSTAQSLSAAAADLAAAKEELEARIRVVDGEVDGVRGDVQRAYRHAEDANTAAIGARSQAMAADFTAHSALSKIKVEGRAPTAADRGNAPGDLWVFRSGAHVAAQYVWTGSAWQNVKAAAGAIGNNAIRHNHVVGSDQLWAKLATFAKVTTPMLVAGEARITESLLAEKINLSTSIIAGNEEGTHTRLDPHGLHVARRNITGEKIDVIRLGTDSSDDYLGITSPDGELVSSLDSAGGASLQSLSVKNAASVGALTVSGVDVGEALAKSARVESFVQTELSQPALKNVAHAAGAKVAVDEHQISNPYDEPMFALYVGSAMSVRVETNAQGREVWGHLGCELRYVDKPLGAHAEPTVNSPVLFQQIMTNQGSGYTSGAMVVPFVVPPRTTRGLLVTVGTDQTRFRIPTHQYSAVVLSLGTRRSESEIPGRIVAWATDTKYGGYTPPPPKQRYEKTYAATWGASYNRNNGGRRHFSYDEDGVVVHGPVPGSNFLDAAMIGFPDMTGDLAGATIHEIKVYLYFSHWWNGSGGTAGVGIHNASSATSQLVGGVRSTTLTTGKPGGGEVRLPENLFAAFKSGVARGILLTPASSNLEEYGLCRWRDARIKIIYSK